MTARSSPCTPRVLRRPGHGDGASSAEATVRGCIVSFVVLAFGTDEETELTRWLVDYLRSEGHTVVRLAEGEEWPEVGRQVAEEVSSGRAERGVVCCFTGTGVSIAANKVPGARAALCTDAATAEGARRWNDANVLAIGLRLTSREVAREMLQAFLATPCDADEKARVDRMEASLG